MAKGVVSKAGSGSKKPAPAKPASPKPGSTITPEEMRSRVSDVVYPILKAASESFKTTQLAHLRRALSIVTANPDKNPAELLKNPSVSGIIESRCFETKGGIRLPKENAEADLVIEVAKQASLVLEQFSRRFRKGPEAVILLRRPGQDLTVEAIGDPTFHQNQFEANVRLSFADGSRFSTRLGMAWTRFGSPDHVSFDITYFDVVQADGTKLPGPSDLKMRKTF